MRLNILRPEDVSEETKQTLLVYLLDHWERASQARAEQLDTKYVTWEKVYKATPREAKRTTPWYGSANFVIPLCRMFIDTFVARTLNIVFATQPLYKIDGFPREVKEALELYVNRKARVEWDHYSLVKSLLNRGCKTGTALTKTVLLDKEEIHVESAEGGSRETLHTVYLGPKSSVIPFEDFAVFPHTANYLSETQIVFHRVRYVEELARQRMDGEASVWDLSEDELSRALKTPADAKKLEQENESSIRDPYLKELEAVECHLSYPISNDPSKLYRIIAIIQPEIRKLLDLYFSPYPPAIELFRDYRPFPQEDLFYGESLVQTLASAQEEVTEIHNDRRNNNHVANCPIFKRKKESRMPNPSTDWYPGKVFDLEEMDDFDAVTIGRNFSDTLPEEGQVMQLAEKLTGIGAVMQGYAGGMMGKRGIYNAQGTIALLQESNQRQDTNIRDIRQVIGLICKDALAIQGYFVADDLSVSLFPPEIQKQIQAGLELTRSSKDLRLAHFEARASSAGSNKEIERTSLIQMAGTLSQYGNAVMGMSAQLANPNLNSLVRTVMMSVVEMQKWMAGRMLRAFDQYDAEGVLPDVAAAIADASRGAREAAQGTPGGAGFEDMVNGGAAAAPFSTDRAGLEALAQMGSAPQ